MSNGTASPRDDSRAAVAAADFDLEQVHQAVRGIKFGEVRVIIQDGHVVQIERVEKERLR